jgi:2,4-dienoyl-CoA reductase-like NADH-dependent reductase (Old Yellow Enzyme family)
LEALFMGARERITDLDLPHIAALPQLLPPLFAAAAARAREAGFDGVELHCAHAYTLSSFLSATNDRPDGYGGTPANRARLPLEVLAAVRQAVGCDFAVGARILAEECIAGGSQVADAEYFATQFAAAGMDFISLSRGGKFDDARQPKVGAAVYPYTGPSGYECMPSYYSDARGPFGRNVEPTRRVREAVRSAGYTAPIVVAGGIHNFQQAESLLEEGAADIVGVARQALVREDPSRARQRGAPVQVHELLRGARSAPPRGDLRAVGSRRTGSGGRRALGGRQAAAGGARLDAR